jgi:quercetin dioxygenase-like cupin family protein
MPKRSYSEGEKMPAAKAVDPAALADYAQGSIVSRTLAESDGGTITLFAFDAGQSLSEHSAPFDALVHVLDGKAELIIGGKAVRPRAGQMVLMPANVPHAVRAAQRFKMLLTMLRSG